MKINQFKLKVHYTYDQDERNNNKLESGKNDDVINKAFLDEKLSKTEGHLSFLEKDHNEFLLNYNKQSVEEILIQRAVKTIIQILYDEG